MPVSRRHVLATVSLGVTGLAGCSGGGDGGTPENGAGTDPTETDGGDDGGDGGSDTTPSPTEPPSPDVVVEMVGTSFEPAVASVDVGATVEWANTSSFGHDVTSIQFHDTAIEWGFSEGVPGSARVRRTFDSAGVYEYYCTIHGEDQMCGAIVVGETEFDQTLPCQGSDNGSVGGY